MGDEQRQILGLAPVARERVGEARDRDVGDREEMVELDAEQLAQLLAVAIFQRGLVGREARAERVVDEVEPAGIRAAVAERAEALQRLDALANTPRPAAARRSPACSKAVTRRCARRGAPETRRCRSGRAGEHGEIAAVDHRAAERAGALDERAELRAQLGRHRSDRVASCGSRASSSSTRRPARVHRLAALGSRLDMAVVAGQVAALADVHLERRRAARRRGQPRRASVLATPAVQRRCSPARCCHAGDRLARSRPDAASSSRRGCHPGPAPQLCPAILFPSTASFGDAADRPPSGGHSL